MANKFVRNITNVRNIEKQEKVTNNQNDLLSDKNHAYIRNNNEYHPLTDNVKTINGMEVDKDNNKNAVSIAVKENGGEVPFTVDGQQLTFDTGNQVKTIQGLPPESNGDFTIQIKQNEEFVPYENIDKGEVIYDLGQVVTSVNGNAPDSDGNIIVSGGEDSEISMVHNFMTKDSMTWEIILNRSIDLSADDIHVTQYIETLNFDIEKSRINVYKNEKTTTITILLADKIVDMVGRYEIEIVTSSVENGAIRAINPIYNDNECVKDYMLGIEGRGNDVYLHFKGGALETLIEEGQIQIFVNGSIQINTDGAVENAYPLAIEVSEGINYYGIVVNGIPVYLSQFYK